MLVAPHGWAAELHVGAGQTYAAVQDAIDAAQAGDVIKVHQGSYNEQLQMDQSGTAASSIVLESADDGDVTINGRVRIDGDYWHLRDLTFVSAAGSDGVRLRGDNNVLERLDLSGGDRDGVDGEGIGNQVLDCSIHNFDAGQSDAHCIVLNPGAEDWVISGNKLFDCSGDGVQLYSQGAERTIKNTVIANNEVYYTGAITRTENAVDVKNADGLTIENNLMFGFDQNKTIVFQKGPANIVVHCNVMHSGFTGVEFREEDGGTVENIRFTRNLMYGFTSYALKFDGTQGAIVNHNTFVNIDNDGLRIEGAGVNGAVVQNNVWLNTGSIEGDGSFMVASNAFFNTANIDIASASDVMLDPKLDATYQPASDSPLIDSGTDLGLPFSGTAPDIGFFETGYMACARTGGGGAGGGSVGGSGGSAAGGNAAGGNAAGGNAAGGATSSSSAAGGGGDIEDNGGCGCRTVNRSHTDHGVQWLSLLAAVLLVRRKRR
jgi:hypothetical protein